MTDYAKLANALDGDVYIAVRGPRSARAIRELLAANERLARTARLLVAVYRESDTEDDQQPKSIKDALSVLAATPSDCLGQYEREIEKKDRALRLAKGRIELLALIIDRSGIEHDSDHPIATNCILRDIDEALAQETKT